MSVAMPEPSRLISTRRTDRSRTTKGTTDTEIAIFAAAERLLAREPLHELSVAQIITEAGISRATFYFYFSSKFAVLVGLLARVTNEMFESVPPFVNRAEGVSLEAALRASLQAGAELWTRHRPAMRAIHEHWNTTDELRSLWLSVMDRFTTALAGQIDLERKRGRSVPGPDSRALAAALLWGTESCLYVAGLDVDPSFAAESDSLEPLLAMWTGTLCGATAPQAEARGLPTS
jgi:AcrR family transcriptional regulator